MKKNIILTLILILFATGFISAQMTRKPTATREPKGVMDKKPDSTKRFLPKITSRKDFDSMARVYHQKTSYALPHAMFVIDRKNKNKIYYVNSQKYRFHKDFMRGNKLVLRGENFFQNVYIKENRRFIVGTIAWQKTVNKFTFEFYAGDLIPAKQIKTTHDQINKTFYDKVSFKPNSNRHDELTENLGIDRVTSSELASNQEYLPLNMAKGIGRIHIIDKLDDTVEIGYNEILVLKEIPFSLPPVAGIIITKPSTPLTHINILSKGWGIPNAYIKDADKLFKEFDTYWVEFETLSTKYNIKLAGLTAVKKEQARRESLNQVFKAPPSNLKVEKLATLKEIRSKDSIVYGAKAANLGEVSSSRIRNIVVPKGFGIPFHYYNEFMERNGFNEKIDELQQDLDFVHNPRHRRKKLKEFRAEIQKGKFDRELMLKIFKNWTNVTDSKGVFIRSSSNAEDMPNFSGAGLYETVQNVKQPNTIIEGVKTVWASLWNYEAYEARERNFIEHNGTYMGVLVQVGVDMDNGGVMITKDPFDDQNKGAVYIAANWGHNLCITGACKGLKDKQIIPEQILYRKASNAVQVLTRSNQDAIMQFDKDGGLKEMPKPKEKRVLTDKVTRDLVKVANQIKRIFGNKKEQDIEWGYKNGTIFILQSRPYIEN